MKLRDWAALLHRRLEQLGKRKHAQGEVRGVRILV